MSCHKHKNIHMFWCSICCSSKFWNFCYSFLIHSLKQTNITHKYHTACIVFVYYVIYVEANTPSSIKNNSKLNYFVSNLPPPYHPLQLYFGTLSTHKFQKWNYLIACNRWTSKCVTQRTCTIFACYLYVSYITNENESQFKYYILSITPSNYNYL